ncbi:MAG: hypothetical protein HC774_05920 [Sphingomonadales bacterium]|nr:hypothetical protein [Sphingomonadales bacterium]
MGERAVRLTNDQKELIASTVAPRDHNTLAVSRMIAIANDRLTILIPGSMSLLRLASENPTSVGRSASP